MTPPTMADDLAAWGKVIGLETIGRASGRPRRVTVGFVTEPDGSLLVAASSPSTAWAANLRADPSCHVTLDDSRRQCRASELEGAARSAAIGALILKYGTPAERLGAGPAFRLRPA